MSLKGGRFLSGLGYQNTQHPHAWDFADNNLMYRALFGEAYGNDGVQLKWVAPTELFMEFGVEAGRGADFPGTDRNQNGVGSHALFGHLGGDVGDVEQLARRAVVSRTPRPASATANSKTSATQTAETLFSGTSKTWVADFVWKWAPNGNATERNFKFATEYFRRSERGSLLCADNTRRRRRLRRHRRMPTARASRASTRRASTSSCRAGAPATATTGWTRATVDFGANSAFLPLTDYSPTRHSLMLDYAPSEFSRLRLQYSQGQVDGKREREPVVRAVHPQPGRARRPHVLRRTP